MPQYDYACPNGHRFTEFRPMAECAVKPKCPECQQPAERDFCAEHGGVFHRAGLWPMKSQALGVMPSQIKEAKDYAAKHGVSVDFTPDGDAILTSRKNRREYAELYGMYDKNGGYGDPQRGGHQKHDD